MNILTVFPPEIIRIIYQFSFMNSEYETVLDQMLKQETRFDVVLDQLRLKYDDGFWWRYGCEHVTHSRRFNVRFTTEDEYGDYTYNVQKNMNLLLQDLLYSPAALRP